MVKHCCEAACRPAEGQPAAFEIHVNAGEVLLLVVGRELPQAFTNSSHVNFLPPSG